MAQYHKIPQNVTKYEGKIIGRFTAKQFIFLAIGAIAIFILINTPIPQQAKIVLSVPIAFLSVVFSLANVQGRTTDMWMSYFLKAVNEPTQRVWRKSESPPGYLLPGYHVEVKRKSGSTASKTDLERFIDLVRPQSAISDLSDEEKKILQRIQADTNLSEEDLAEQEVSANIPIEEPVAEPLGELEQPEQDNG